MHLLNPLFAVLLSLLAALLVRTTFLWNRGTPASVRFGSIDGLRGYLAFFVFLHHATIWFIYCQKNIWVAPDSHLYNHLGQCSVALFFMITSFLFYDKLLNIRLSKFEWKSFFINRFFRLMPLYALIVAVIVITVAILSHWTLNERPQLVLASIIDWLLFTIPGVPYINHINPFYIIAGVTWSLPYEVCFYLVLPIIALISGTRPPWYTLFISVIAIATAWLMNMELQYLIMFAGGLVAARLVRHEKFTKFSRTFKGSTVAVVCFAFLLLFPTVYQIIPFLCLSTAFCLIAGGADLFGILVSRISRRFGELAYSI